MPNPITSLDAAMRLLFQIVRQRRGASEFLRSPAMRAKRAKLKSRRDVIIIAPGKRSAGVADVK